MDNLKTTAASFNSSTPDELIPQYSEFKRVIYVFLGRKIVIVGLAIIIGLLLTALFAPWLTPYDPYKIDITKKLLKPNKHTKLKTESG